MHALLAFLDNYQGDLDSDWGDISDGSGSTIFETPPPTPFYMMELDLEHGVHVTFVESESQNTPPPVGPHPDVSGCLSPRNHVVEPGEPVSPVLSSAPSSWVEQIVPSPSSPYWGYFPPSPFPPPSPLPEHVVPEAPAESQQNSTTSANQPNQDPPDDTSTPNPIEPSEGQMAPGPSESVVATSFSPDFQDTHRRHSITRLIPSDVEDLFSDQSSDSGESTSKRGLGICHTRKRLRSVGSSSGLGSDELMVPRKRKRPFSTSLAEMYAAHSV